MPWASFVVPQKKIKLMGMVCQEQVAVEAKRSTSRDQPGSRFAGGSAGARIARWGSVPHGSVSSLAAPGGLVSARQPVTKYLTADLYRKRPCEGNYELSKKATDHSCTLECGREAAALTKAGTGAPALQGRW